MNTLEVLEQAEKEWAIQGRTEEQQWAVRNFLTGAAKHLTLHEQKILTKLAFQLGTDVKTLEGYLRSK